MTTTMIDTVGANVSSIPVTAEKVAGYVTGSGVVPWTAADWARFPHSGHVRIDQSPAGHAPLASDVLDVENLAATPATVPTWVKTRMAAGKPFSDVYASRSTVPRIVAALNAAGKPGWYGGHVRLWLADWNLSHNDAAALVGTRLDGLLVVAVQWASPSSNPNTPLPGSHLTLRQANCDLSVTADYWHAPPGAEPPPPVEEVAYLVPIHPVGVPYKVTRPAGTRPWT